MYYRSTGKFCTALSFVNKMAMRRMLFYQNGSENAYVHAATQLILLLS